MRGGRALRWMVWGLIGFAGSVAAEDLTIHMPGEAAVQRQTVKYQCDATGAKIGVPAAAFAVEYINGGGNSLVVVPLGAKSLIFANVSAGSGARYVAQQYTWWEAGGAVTLSSDAISGKLQSTCRRVEGK